MNRKNHMIVVIAAIGLSSMASAWLGPVKPSVTPKDALNRLTTGNERFAQGMGQHPRTGADRRTEVAKGQAPFASILTCADSRVSPELVFDQGLGDLFVTRVAGNTFGRDILGSLEYSVAVLGSRLIVVLGHERCGAVDAAIKGGELPGSIGSVVAPIEPAVRATRTSKGDRLLETTIKNVELTVERIAKQSSIFRDLIRKGELKIVGGYYDLDSGAVRWVKN